METSVMNKSEILFIKIMLDWTKKVDSLLKGKVGEKVVSAVRAEDGDGDGDVEGEGGGIVKLDA